MSNITYQRKGLALRGPPPDEQLSRCHSLFKHVNDNITYVTFVRNTWKYHHTQINAKIITFYDMRIAYIEKMEVIQENTEYFDDGDGDEDVRVRSGSHLHDEYLLPYLTPDGIDDLRFKDGPYLYEVFMVWRKIYMNLTQVYPIMTIMSENTILPNDIIEDIINLSLTDNKTQSAEDKNPFKVQGYKHGSNRAEYRVVPFDQPNGIFIEEGYTAIWFDM
jgi:hypothetical protein